MSPPTSKSTIESLCLKVTSGATPSRQVDEYWANGTIPWVKSGELKDNHIYGSAEHITETAISESSARTFPENTVLMAMYGDGKTITSLGIVKSEAAANQACCAMIADPQKCHYRFLFYSLMLRRRELLPLVVAGAQRNLSVSIIKNFEIDILPVPAQHCIVSILAAYDDLIENNRRRIQLLDEAARLLYKEWFVHLRFPGHEHVEIVEGVPEGWNPTTLGDVAPLKYGKALKADDRVPGPFPVFGSSGIVGSHESALAKGPGIVLGRKGNVGSSYWSEFDFFPIDTVFYIDSDPGLYLYYSLKHMSFINTDVAVPGLNRNLAHSRKLLEPTKRLKQLFEEYAGDFHRQMASLERQNRELAKARDILLPRLMNGDIPV